MQHAFLSTVVLAFPQTGTLSPVYDVNRNLTDFIVVFLLILSWYAVGRILTSMPMSNFRGAAF